MLGFLLLSQTQMATCSYYSKPFFFVRKKKFKQPPISSLIFSSVFLNFPNKQVAIKEKKGQQIEDKIKENLKIEKSKKIY